MVEMMSFELSAAEAAHYLGISEDALIRRAKSGKFKWRASENGTIFLSKNSLDDHLKEQAAEHAEFGPCLRCGGFDSPYGGAYRRRRVEALRRSEGTCQLCGLHEATETHHWAKPDRYPCGSCVTSQDLIGLCKACHDIATELRSLLYATDEELILGTTGQWAGEDDSLPLVFRHSSQASTRRGDRALTTWIDRYWSKVMVTSEAKLLRRKPGGESIAERKKESAVEIDLSLRLELDERLAERAMFQASLQDMDVREWLQSLVVRGRAGNPGVGPWVESLIENALEQD